MARTWLPVTIALALSFPLAATSAQAQLPPTPPPTLASGGACLAQVRIEFDVRSVAGADRIQWQLWRGAPGQLTAPQRVDRRR